MDRRRFLQGAAAVGGAAVVWPRLLASAAPGDGPYGPLAATADANGLHLPAGFTSRVVATTGQPVAGTGYTWHPNPDGGATFPGPDGGWTYVSNSESGIAEGGASSVTFGPDGAIVGARRILGGTIINCAGGPTPWGTWLSCEEHPDGQVWECDPAGAVPAAARPAMGRFQHEAAAVDPVHHAVYLTEDQPDGALYRFVPATWPDLAAGRLDVLVGGPDGRVSWAPVPDPSGGAAAPTRNQVAGTVRFPGGEGAWFDGERLWFTTKGNGRVWHLDPASTTVAVVYDAATSPTPVLTGVDNVTVSATGDAYVAEDGGNLEIVVLTPEGVVAPFLRVAPIDGTELTGPAFSPDGSRLYFSSQRFPGRTYEVTGPFRRPAAPPTTPTTPTTTTATPTTGNDVYVGWRPTGNRP